MDSIGKAGVSIEEVHAQFEQWRNNRSPKARIPEELWAVAIEIARREGVNRTAQALRLDGGKLKRLLVAAGPGNEKPVCPARFVELVSPDRPQPEECVIEFESAGGSKMRIQWKTTIPPDWTGLLRACRDAER